MELNEIIALAIAVCVISILVIYEIHMYRHMRGKIRRARDEAAHYAALYSITAEERDLLHYRVQSRDCQKVIGYQLRVEELEDEVKRLTDLNETYKQQLERNKKRKESSK